MLKTNNPLLKQTEDQILSRIKPELKEPLNRTVTAGLTLMYAPAMQQNLLKQMGKPGDYASKVAEGSAKLTGILYLQSKKTMPLSIMIPTATLLMCEGLDFLERSGKVKVDGSLLAAAMKELSAYMLQLLGITPQQVAQVVNKGKQGAQPGQPAGAGIVGSQMQGA
ncbi:hypothetical protein D9M73_82600 [compost metagenome]|nr:MAG TPA: hypothetical protein [Caudoviricetes sp.]